jgi:hypothetical protein
MQDTRDPVADAVKSAENAIRRQIDAAALAIPEAPLPVKSGREYDTRGRGVVTITRAMGTDVVFGKTREGVELSWYARSGRYTITGEDPRDLTRLLPVLDTVPAVVGQTCRTRNGYPVEVEAFSTSHRQGRLMGRSEYLYWTADGKCTSHGAANDLVERLSRSVTLRNGTTVEVTIRADGYLQGRLPPNIYGGAEYRWAPNGSSGSNPALDIVSGVPLAPPEPPKLDNCRCVAVPALRVIGFAGLPGSGKDTAADMIRDHGPSGEPRHKRPFAGPLKEAAAQMFGFSATQLHGPSAERDKVDPRLGFTPRKALELLGTEVARGLDSEYWLKAWRKSLPERGVVVVPDVRFQNEVDAIHAMGGKVYWIERDANAKPSAHASQQLGTRHCDHFIANCSDLKALRRELEALGLLPKQRAVNVTVTVGGTGEKPKTFDDGVAACGKAEPGALAVPLAEGSIDWALEQMRNGCEVERNSVVWGRCVARMLNSGAVEVHNNNGILDSHYGTPAAFRVSWGSPDNGRYWRIVVPAPAPNSRAWAADWCEKNPGSRAEDRGTTCGLICRVDAGVQRWAMNGTTYKTKAELLAAPKIASSEHWTVPQ